MKRWFALMTMAMAVTMCRGAEEWVSRELADASQHLTAGEFARAYDIYHNLLLVNRAAPLDKEQAQQARNGVASVISRIKVKNPNTPSREFATRCQAAKYIQIGPVWIPQEAKARLKFDALSRLTRMGMAPPCAACKGKSATECTKCKKGDVECPACKGLKKGPNNEPCRKCAGRGSNPCRDCAGRGFQPCPTCDCTGVGG